MSETPTGVDYGSFGAHPAPLWPVCGRAQQMSRPEIIRWFDRNWVPTWDRARVQGWGTLSRPDQVLVAVGFLLDSFLSDAVLLVVDGMATGYDTGLTAHMPA